MASVLLMAMVNGTFVVKFVGAMLYSSPKSTAVTAPLTRPAPVPVLLHIELDALVKPGTVIALLFVNLWPLTAVNVEPAGILKDPGLSQFVMWIVPLALLPM